MKVSFQLTMAAVVLSAAAAACGLFLPRLYQDNAFVQMAWRGNDWVTLLAIVPAILLTLYAAARKSRRAQLIGMGLAGYLFYNYAFYLFGAAYNAAFLLYVAIVTLSAYALITGLSAFPIRELMPVRGPVRWIAAYLLFIALVLCMVEIPPNLGYWSSGELPETIRLTGHPTAIVYALDLTLVVPALVLGAVLLWRKQAWGVILGVLMLVKCATYGLVLVVNTLLLQWSGLAADPLLPFYLFILLGGLAGLWWLMIRPGEVEV